MLKKITLKLFIMSSILFLFNYLYNFSFAATNIEGTVKEDLGRSLNSAPIKGVRVTLKNKDTSNKFSTVSNAEGKFTFYDVIPGEYSIEYKYGDLTVVDEFPDKCIKEEDVLKYNGQDYIVSYMNGVTESIAEQIIPKAYDEIAQVILVIDTSGSMRCPIKNDNNTPLEKDGIKISEISSLAIESTDTRMAQVKQASRRLVDKIISEDENIYVGLIEFNTEAKLLCNLCRDSELLKRKIDRLTPEGTTNAASALNLANIQFIGRKGARIIVFLSDGYPNEKIRTIEAIARVRIAGVELFSAIIEDDISDNLQVQEIFHESPTGSTVFQMKKSGYELAECISEYIPTWIINKVEETRRKKVETQESTVIELDGTETQRGIEDTDRRNEVDSYFSKNFYYNYKARSNEAYSLSGKTQIFKSIDDASEFSKQELLDFSNHTYMTITCDNVIVQENTTISNLNLKLKRRTPFLMEIAMKAIAFRITLSDGTVLVEDISNSEDVHMFYTCFDQDISYGSEIEVEYEVTVRNNSNEIVCTQLELLSYLPIGLMLSENQNLITDKEVTNYKNGWFSIDKDDLYNSGYISNSAYTDDLMPRSVAKFDSASTNGFCLGPNLTYKTNFVASVCIGNLEQLNLKHSAAVEVLGYRNTGYRRMEYVQNDEEEKDNISSNTRQVATFKSLYPGDGKKDDVDYAKDSNLELLVPPTGRKNNLFLKIILIFSVISLIYISKEIKKEIK